MIPKIETVKSPQVGKFYLVPCVKFFRGRGRRAVILPIIGPWHEDADIGVPTHHFHYDMRFLSESDYPVFYMAKVHTFAASHIEPMGLDSPVPPEVTIRRRKMRRQMPDFPTRRGADRAVWQVKLEQEFASQTLKCRSCPHRGMSLDGLPVDARGRVVCNGHGLRWNLTTGKLSPRDEA